MNEGRIEEFCRRWEVAELSLFGSLARGDFREDSDADVLITFREGASHSVDRFVMVEQLEEIFGRKVDLVQERYIENPYRRHNILLDKRVLYPAQTLRIEEIRDRANRFERDIALIWDIIQAGQEVIAATEGKTFDDYLGDSMLRAAVERWLIIIGEASRAFSKPFRTAHAEIPWSEIIAERNILVHNYRRIEHDTVWRIATVHVPRLLTELKPLLP